MAQAKINALTRSKKQKAEKALKAGKLEEAEKLFASVCQKDPSDISAWLKLGSVYGAQNKFTKVAKCARQVLSIDPNNPTAHTFLGNIYTATGQQQHAIESYRKALELEPRNLDTLTNLAVLYLSTGDQEKAIETWEKVLQSNPEHLESLNNLATTCMDLGRITDALKYYGELTKLLPDNLDYQIGLATACLRCGLFSRAETLLLKCLPLADEPEALLVLLSDTQRVAGNLEKAARYCADALKIKPNYTPALAREAEIFYRLGRREEAYTQIRKLIDRGELTAGVVNVYSQFCHHYNKSNEVIELGKKVLATQKLQKHDRAVLHFNIGRVLDKEKRYDEAFEHFKTANNLISEKFDRNKFRAHIDSLIEIYSKENIKRFARSSILTTRPIFIVGMPRSGTTLVEQIISSHPSVYGAGELNDIHEIATEFIPALMGNPTTFPEYAPFLDNSILDQAAERYLNRLNSFNKESKHITDKLPQNFLKLGLIMQLFPRAHIIHCVRHPYDTALSIYFQHFMNAHSYSFNLKDIGYVYTQYRRLMRHWENVLDLPILEVSYKSLVDDFEGTIQRILRFLSLEWSDKCLHFYKSARNVATASYDQVRNPIYSTSIDRWKHYERHLDPLKEILPIQ